MINKQRPVFLKDNQCSDLHGPNKRTNVSLACGGFCRVAKLIRSLLCDSYSSFNLCIFTYVFSFVYGFSERSCNAILITF